jgi:hypothetical protein
VVSSGAQLRAVFIMEPPPSLIERTPNEEHAGNGWRGMARSSTCCDRLLAAHYRKGVQNGQRDERVAGGKA